MQYVNVTTAENTFTVEQTVYSSAYTWQQTLAGSRVPISKQKCSNTRDWKNHDKLYIFLDYILNVAL